MKAFIWTTVILFALESAAACINLAKGVELSAADRALGAAVHIAFAVWGAYVVAGVGA